MWQVAAAACLWHWVENRSEKRTTSERRRTANEDKFYFLSKKKYVRKQELRKLEVNKKLYNPQSKKNIPPPQPTSRCFSS